MLCRAGQGERGEKRGKCDQQDSYLTWYITHHWVEDEQLGDTYMNGQLAVIYLAGDTHRRYRNPRFGRFPTPFFLQLAGGTS